MKEIVPLKCICHLSVIVENGEVRKVVAQIDDVSLDKDELKSKPCPSDDAVRAVQKAIEIGNLPCIELEE